MTISTFSFSGCITALGASAFLLFVPVDPAMAGCSDYPGAGVDWSGCRKRNVILSGEDFSKAQLKKADLTGSDLRESRFDEANFSRSMLSHVMLCATLNPDSIW